MESDPKLKEFSHSFKVINNRVEDIKKFKGKNDEQKTWVAMRSSSKEVEKQLKALLIGYGYTIVHMGSFEGKVIQ